MLVKNPNSKDLDNLFTEDLKSEGNEVDKVKIPPTTNENDSEENKSADLTFKRLGTEVPDKVREDENMKA